MVRSFHDFSEKKHSSLPQLLDDKVTSHLYCDARDWQSMSNESSKAMLKPLYNHLGRAKSPVARKFSPAPRKVENTATVWISMSSSHLCGRNLFSEPIFGILNSLQVIRDFTKVPTKKRGQQPRHKRPCCSPYR